MHYPVDPALTTDGQAVGVNWTLPRSINFLFSKTNQPSIRQQQHF
jgi:hypothetical protein